MTELLNDNQRTAYLAVKEGRSIFLTGSGGTGKSFLLNLIYDTILKETGRKVALTALTGCASLLLHSKAKTIHSWAGIGLGKEPVPLLVANVRKSRKALLRWHETDILVIDEVSMMTPDLFEKLDEVARKIRRNPHTPFGGIQMILSGDFYQLPPVVRVEETQDTKFVFESPLWKDMRLQTHELTEIVRQRDPVFQKVLNEARQGELSKESLKILSRRMGLNYKSEKIQPTMLFTRRAQVNEINMRELRKLTTERRIYKAITTFNTTISTLTQSDKDPLVLKAVEKMDNDAAYAAELIVAIGAQVMLITNLKPEKGLVNGTRGVVIGYEAIQKDEADITPAFKIDESVLVPVVEFKNGLKMPIGYSTWDIPDMTGILRRQIPLKLAYAITIHKSQGATLDCALIDVGGRTFEFGQAYVALSRVKDLEGLYIHDLEKTAFRAHEKVKEFYKSALITPSCI
jgi:ATP-dependent DNA helicase PIF1